MEILNKFNLAPPPSSPSKGGINKVFPPQEGDLRGRKVLFGMSVGFPLWRGTKGEEFFVWASDAFPPLGGGQRGRKVLYGASDAFPPLEGDKGGGILYEEEKS